MESETHAKNFAISPADKLFITRMESVISFSAFVSAPEPAAQAMRLTDFQSLISCAIR